MAKKKVSEEVTVGGSFFDLIQKVDKSAEIIADSAYSNINDWISTGSYILNACISGSIFGGIPGSRVSTFAGESGAGKSYLACSVVREAQKKGYDAIYIDSEGAIDAKFVSRLGVDPKKLIIKQVQTISETSNFISNVLKALETEHEKTGNKRKVIFVIDSLGNLTSDKEKEDILAGAQKRDMTKQQEIKAMFRVIATPLARMDAAMIVVSHVYAQIGAYVPTNVLSGGCVLPSEKVYTLENGLIEISNITEGMHVMGYDKEYHSVKKVWHFYKPTYTITFSGNISITCSDTHRFLSNKEYAAVDEGWVNVSDLQVGDKIYSISENNVYNILSVTNITYNSCVREVMDLTVADVHSYVSENGIINHNSGLKYNSSVTLELSTKKLEDKENDNNAAQKAGNGAVKNGVLVTAKPIKSRFSVPRKCSMQIPFFKAPSPYVGLEEYLNWDNAGVCRGNVLTEKEYTKLSAADQAKCHQFEYAGNQLYALEKDTARGIAVKHLGRQVSFIEFWSDTVFTDEFLHYIDENVIRPLFELPDQSSFDDLKEMEELIDSTEDVDNNTPDPIEDIISQ